MGAGVKEPINIHTMQWEVKVSLLAQKLKSSYILALETNIATSVRELNQWPARQRRMTVSRIRTCLVRQWRLTSLLKDS